jgi:RNA methyltransferase, TrmH family
MLSKSQISLVNSLQHKKYRKQWGLFMVEGLKSITEFIHSDYCIDTLFITTNASKQLPNLPQNIKVFEVNEQELKKISALQTPQDAVAIVKVPLNDNNLINQQAHIHLLLDGVQDPGNLGTIIRTANWFGYKHIFCSPHTVDAYNPKVVQATMGALSQVKIIYTNLITLLSENKLPVYAGLLNGKNLYHTTWQSNAFLILGCEGTGISEQLMPFITHAITIPGKGHTESLNVAISAAIFCAEIQRNLDK